MDTPRPSPRTNRTRRVPHPVLIGRDVTTPQAHPAWKEHAPRPYDPPITVEGRAQARQTAQVEPRKSGLPKWITPPGTPHGCRRCAAARCHRPCARVLRVRRCESRGLTAGGSRSLGAAAAERGASRGTLRAHRQLAVPALPPGPRPAPRRARPGALGFLRRACLAAAGGPRPPSRARAEPRASCPRGETSRPWARVSPACCLLRTGRGTRRSKMRTGRRLPRRSRVFSESREFASTMA